MELRKRHVAAAPGVGSAAHSLADKVRALDAYPKTLDDFKERTSSGAAISVVCCSLIAALVVSELSAFLSASTLDELHVDTTRFARIHINFNLTFPHMPCSGLSLVAMDVAGEQQIDVVSNINKSRYDLQGNYLGEEVDETIVTQRIANGCGKCFPQVQGRAEERDLCCNSCADVKALYDRRQGSEGSKLKWEEHPLCLHEVCPRERL